MTLKMNSFWKTLRTMEPVPNRGKQMVRYYGYYCNVSRGKRQMAGRDNEGTCILEP